MSLPARPRGGRPVHAASARAGRPALPVDSDVDLHEPAQRAELGIRLLGVISVGGALGASARYGLGVAVPAGPTGFPWATFGINVLGCLLIGVLMVLVTELFPTRRLLRPFVGVGVLGGFTTFSTYVVEIQHLLTAGALRTALLYLGGTVVAAVAATWLGLATTRLVVSR
jgi:CrcB protein